jgi:hypothetical protein
MKKNYDSVFLYALSAILVEKILNKKMHIIL